MKDKWKEIVSIAVSAVLALLLFAALLVGLGWNMLLCMGLSLVSYAGFLLVLRPVRRIGRIDIEKLGNGEVLHERLQEAGRDYRRMREAADRIQAPGLRQSASELIDIAGNILKFLTDNPRKIPSARRYIDYYQETAANVLENYVEQTPISAWIYIVIFAGMAVLIALCIGWRVWRAANENPAEVVKSE